MQTNKSSPCNTDSSYCETGFISLPPTTFKRKALIDGRFEDLELVKDLKHKLL